MNILVLCANDNSFKLKTAYHILKYDLDYFSKENTIFNMYYIGQYFSDETKKEEGVSKTFRNVIKYLKKMKFNNYIYKIDLKKQMLENILDPSLFFDIIIDELCPKQTTVNSNYLRPIYYINMSYLKSRLKGDFITYIRPKQYRNKNYFNEIFKKNEKITIEKKINIDMYNNDENIYFKNKINLLFLIYKNYKIIIKDSITDEFFNEISQDENITEIIYNYNVVDPRIFTLKQIKIIDFKTQDDLINNIDFFQTPYNYVMNNHPQIDFFETCYNYLIDRTDNYPLTIKFCNWKLKLDYEINGKTIYRMIQDLYDKDIRVWLDHRPEQINQIIRTMKKNVNS